jgi:ComF family protein
VNSHSTQSVTVIDFANVFKRSRNPVFFEITKSAITQFMIIHLLKLLIDTVLPHHCLICNKISHLDKDLCQTCWLILPWLLSGCRQCGRPLDVAHTKELYCGPCLIQSPHYDTTIAPLIYQDPIIGLITKLKFYNNLAAARLFAQLISDRALAKYSAEELPTLLIPVPLHSKRLRQRGYNQAQLIAKHIAKLTNIPVDHNLCTRVRHTSAQSKTNAFSRRSNIIGAFKLNKACIAKHVAIIDDVMTTGTTVGVLSQLLKQQGVERVSIWCVARV